MKTITALRFLLGLPFFIIGAVFLFICFLITGLRVEGETRYDED